MKTRTYTVVLDADPDGEGYTVTVPALPGCITEGGTVAEALDNVREAISLYIEGLEEAGRAVPEEVTPVVVEQVTVSA